MFVKIFLSAIIFFANLFFVIAKAEQPAAQEYRKIFASGNFYVEFKDKWGTRILAAKNNMRMERMRYDFESGAGIWFNPLAGLFQQEDKNPEVIYKNGKFYHFVESKKANVCDEKNLRGENMDPRQGWNVISQKLALPDELAIFFWNDSYRLKSSAIDAPIFVESTKKILGGKEFDCDRYICKIKNLSGEEKAQLIFDAFYSEGKIFRVETSIFRNQNFYPVNVLSVKKIQSEIPEGTFKIEKGTKIFAAGTGDINDLLEQPTSLGTVDSLEGL